MNILKLILLAIWDFLTTPPPIVAATEPRRSISPRTERAADETTCKGDVNNIACQIEFGDELDAWHYRDRNPLDDKNDRFDPWE